MTKLQIISDKNTKSSKIKKLLVKKLNQEQFKINNYPHINLLDNFSEDYTNSYRSAFFEIDGHWNKKGHKVVANALINYLKNIKLD